MTRPLIGIVMNYDQGGGYFSKYPWYALRENYFKSIQNAGGAPIAIPYHEDAIPSYASKLNGLIIAGGEDYPPEFYGDTPSDAVKLLPGGRASFDMKIIEAMLDMKKPLLGICAGEQAINIYFGGTLYQDIPEDLPGSLNHLNQNPAHLLSHPLEIVEGTLLHRCVGKTRTEVNSVHHQSVRLPGKGLVVNSHAPDGIIEGVEHPDHKFCLGVEWHPEFELHEEDQNILKAFVHAAKT